MMFPRHTVINNDNILIMISFLTESNVSNMTKYFMCKGMTEFKAVG